jgi:hypothetical protein
MSQSATVEKVSQPSRVGALDVPMITRQLGSLDDAREAGSLQLQDDGAANTIGFIIYQPL